MVIKSYSFYVLENTANYGMVSSKCDAHYYPYNIILII